MSILEDLMGAGAQVAELAFAYRANQAEVAATKERAAAERAAQEAALLQAQTMQSGMYTFARYALFATVGLAGLALMVTAKRMWKAR